MTLDEYRKAHPGKCRLYGEDRESTCFVDMTYAGIKTLETANFFDHRLYEISFLFDPIQVYQVSSGLRERYGEPETYKIDDQSTLTWKNGLSTIHLLNTAKASTLTFTLDELSEKASTEFERKRALERKIDM